MAQKIAELLPSTQTLLRQLGERLRLARLRRRLTAKQVCERAGMAPMTLRSLERGGSGVTIGAYVVVMQVLGIEGDLGLLAKADALGRDLQDAGLLEPKSARKRGKVAVNLPGQKMSPTVAPLLGTSASSIPKGFVDSVSLSRLLELPSHNTESANRGH